MDKDYKTIEEVLQKSVAFLQAKGIDNAKTDTEWIISSILGIPRLQLYLNLGELIKGKELDDIRKGIVERGNRIPCNNIFLGRLNLLELIFYVTVGLLSQDLRQSNLLSIL